MKCRPIPMSFTALWSPKPPIKDSWLLIPKQEARCAAAVSNHGGRKAGRARHGSIRSPIWVGGGVTFGPRSERSYKIKINKKEKQKALFMVLSSKVKDAEMALVEDLNLKEPKTKTMSEILKAVFSGAFSTERLKKTLIVVSKNDNNAELSARNLPVAKVVRADSLNVYDLLSHKYLIMSQEAVATIDQTFKKLG